MPPVAYLLYLMCLVVVCYIRKNSLIFKCGSKLNLRKGQLPQRLDQSWSEQMCVFQNRQNESQQWKTHLVELVGTFPAEIMLTGKNDHRLVEDFLTDGTDEMFVQHRDCWTSLRSVTAAATSTSVLMDGWLRWQWHGCFSKLPSCWHQGWQSEDKISVLKLDFYAASQSQWSIFHHKEIFPSWIVPSHPPNYLHIENYFIVQFIKVEFLHLSFLTKLNEIVSFLPSKTKKTHFFFQVINQLKSRGQRQKVSWLPVCNRCFYSSPHALTLATLIIL